MPTFTIVLTTTIELDARDIWPEGETPTNPTAHDAIAAMEAAGDKETVIADWMLHDEPTVYVNGHQAWADT